MRHLACTSINHLKCLGTLYRNVISQNSTKLCYKKFCIKMTIIYFEALSEIYAYCNITYKMRALVSRGNNCI